MLRSFKPGWRWKEGNMVFRRAWELEEIAAGLTPTKKTELKFEMETAV